MTRQSSPAVEVRPRVTPFLWYDGCAEEAARYYVSVFKKGSQVTSASPMSVTFDLEGQAFIALNGGPGVRFNPAVSLFVECRTQREVDHYWDKLSAGGREGQCGWLQDRWGLSWQVVPRTLHRLLQGRDRAGAQRTMEAMLGMKKLSIAALQAAYRADTPPRRRR